MKTSIVLIVLFPLFACTSPNKNDSTLISQIDSIPSDKKVYTEDIKQDLIDKVIHFGDTIAYERLVNEYSFRIPSYEFMYPSMIMANVYKRKEGFFYTYVALNNVIGVDLDPKTEKLAFYFLLKSFEMNDSNAIKVVKEEFKGKKIPTSSSYLIDLAEMN